MNAATAPEGSDAGGGVLLVGTAPLHSSVQQDEAVQHEDATRFDTPWTTVVWNDPVNLMNYVARVFRRYFGFSPEEAQRLMLQVHHDGRAVVATGPREEMERHVEAMHEFGLWATVGKAGS
ncbi:ATP-dependent Clp protease adapter ClpS [Homoserinibacter sp. YIM 151385]|uniref:ATP-dependent Clp protease adapter ClpS n=1 Tax=Homoserinibacter sp. YIM 151385 TaxID=2985506 RepID=UPI0022F0ABE9|nr:ATP-dependent Clp protease adapter ClpS [Homoserinibacter sp. YIM 151385]WBU39063.1 ATP-dependent Clp protease adapter ClpS [Homoserinibacter sp. YIM 151385]